MSLPSDVPELATPSADAADAAEVARCLEEAARTVQNFADTGGQEALAALIATAEEDPGPAVEQALELATAVTERTETLYGEVTRFLATTKDA